MRPTPTRDTALADRDTARTAQQRAEARLEDARDREERAERRAGEAGDRAASAENRLAGLAAERDALTDQLTGLRADLADERDRAAAAAHQAQETIDDLQRRLERQRDEHAQARDQIRDEAHAEITRIRETAEHEAAAARAELTQAQRDHTTQLGELRHQLGSLTQQVTSLDQRATDAETAHHHAATQLAHWRRTLTIALTEPDGHGQQLATRIEQLLAEDDGTA
ncbi:hypothetical protein [Haloactinomyces albus]|uniref:Chromosome segregation ATPase n=1 Tax=Haloactinomyces albus TaxID=1352928 RepID=A0AAE3ZGH2_9ACTN|nr:hypothetical protein [Haloactinomyces albus]MDR7304491.1 chromosome segregation ATPase [Haloactinomyces albus]